MENQTSEAKRMSDADKVQIAKLADNVRAGDDASINSKFKTSTSFWIFRLR